MRPPWPDDPLADGAQKGQERRSSRWQQRCCAVFFALPPTITALRAAVPLPSAVVAPPVLHRPAPFAAGSLIFPGESKFDRACARVPAWTHKVLQPAGRDARGRSVLYWWFPPGRYLKAKRRDVAAGALAQHTLCALETAARGIGWNRPRHAGKLYRLAVVVDLGSVGSWLDVVKAASLLLPTLVAIEPFAGAQYDLLLGSLTAVQVPQAARVLYALLVKPLLKKDALAVLSVLGGDPCRVDTYRTAFSGLQALPKALRCIQAGSKARLQVQPKVAEPTGNTVQTG